MNRSTVRVLVGYDGSLTSGAAIGACARLLPDAHATVGHLWTPPFASDQLRRRLWSGARHVDGFVEAVEREGLREAERVAGMGVALAHAAGWSAEPVVARCYGSEGFALTELARKLDADVLLVGSRGLGGSRAVLGSVSDMAVHYAGVPVLVAPYPLLVADDDALAHGAVVVGWDGSVGARGALEAVLRLWPERQVVLASVDLDGDPPDVPAGAHITAVRVSSRRERFSPAIADALAAVGQEHGAAVLVLGSRGRSAVREIVLGSVAMSVLHRAHRLVMIVPQEDSGQGTEGMPHTQL